MQRCAYPHFDVDNCYILLYRPVRVDHILANNPDEIRLSAKCVLKPKIIFLPDPGTRCDTLISDFPEKLDTMPKNLLDAIRTLEKDEYMCAQLGPELVEGFSFLKNKEWDIYMSQISQWEMDYYFNC